uniref:Tubulin tyrosine ligase like 11 n=1 Tax=Leptobrachium leishanense TaxID=445787 RepID=A0A8C5WM20_9ANUR
MEEMLGAQCIWRRGPWDISRLFPQAHSNAQAFSRSRSSLFWPSPAAARLRCQPDPNNPAREGGGGAERGGLRGQNLHLSRVSPAMDGSSNGARAPQGEPEAEPEEAPGTGGAAGFTQGGTGGVAGCAQGLTGGSAGCTPGGSAAFTQGVTGGSAGCTQGVTGGSAGCTQGVTGGSAGCTQGVTGGSAWCTQGVTGGSAGCTEGVTGGSAGCTEGGAARLSKGVPGGAAEYKQGVLGGTVGYTQDFRGGASGLTRGNTGYTQGVVREVNTWYIQRVTGAAGNTHEVKGGDTMYTHEVKGGDTAYTREVEGGDTMYTHEVKGGDTVHTREVKGGDTAHTHEVEGGDTMYTHEVKGGDTVHTREVKGGDTAHTHEVKGGDTMYTREVKGGDTVHTREVKGGDTVHTREVKGGDTAHTREVKGDTAETQGVIERDPTYTQGARGGDAAETQGVRGGDTVYTQGVRGGDTVYTQGVRGGDTVYTQGVRGGDTVYTQGVRGGDTVYTQGVRGGDAAETQGVRGGDTVYTQGVRGGDTAETQGLIEGDTAYAQEMTVRGPGFEQGVKGEAKPGKPGLLTALNRKELGQESPNQTQQKEREEELRAETGQRHRAHLEWDPRTDFGAGHGLGALASTGGSPKVLVKGAEQGISRGRRQECVRQEGQVEQEGGPAWSRQGIPPVTGERVSIRTKQEEAMRARAEHRFAGGRGLSESPEIRQRGSAMIYCRNTPGVWRGGSPSPVHGDTRSSTKPKGRGRRAESEDRRGQRSKVGGTERFLSPTPREAIICHIDATERSDRKVPRSSVKAGSQQEDRGVQKKKQKRQVTVDSSKAKTSLEALKFSIKQLRWKEFPLGRRLPCDIYWHGVSFHESENISSGQVNKFPGMAEMVRKINLSRAVRTMQELFPEEYNFYPQSWILPDEFHLFAAQVRMAKENNPLWKPTFIVKPDGGCQGDGIYLIKDPADFRVMGSLQNRPAVVQEYMSRPLLMDKLKFDIRLYVVLKSLEPLEIYVAKEGLSRFCTEPYQEPHQKNLHKVYMHLTNYSLNIHSGNFIHSDSGHTGSKRTFSSVLYRLSAKGVDIKKVWSDIISLVIKTIIALVPELKVYHQADIPPGKPGPSCFQLLPGVFENVPSLVDEEVKIAVIRDTLRLMDPTKRKTSYSSPCTSDISLDTEKELPMGPGDKAEPGINSNPESHLPSFSLKQVFPKYAKQFNYLRSVERMSSVFIRFLGIKGTMKLGPTGFRTFIRSCKLSNSNFSMASVDILYIDITRRWNSMGLDQRESGMCLQAFVEAFFYLAQRRFKSLVLKDQVETLLTLCETHLESLDEKKLLSGKGLAECKTPLSRCRHTGLHVTSYTPLLHRTNTSYKLTDYKLQHS